MNIYQYYKLLGKLEGLREACHTVPSQMDDKIKRLEIQLQGITVHDEVAELKAQLAKVDSVIKDVKIARDSHWHAIPDDRCSGLEIYDDIISRFKALKSLEGKDE